MTCLFKKIDLYLKALKQKEIIHYQNNSVELVGLEKLVEIVKFYQDVCMEHVQIPLSVNAYQDGRDFYATEVKMRLKHYSELCNFSKVIYQ